MRPILIWWIGFSFLLVILFSPLKAGDHSPFVTSVRVMVSRYGENSRFPLCLQPQSEDCGEKAGMARQEPENDSSRNQQPGHNEPLTHAMPHRDSAGVTANRPFPSVLDDGVFNKCVRSGHNVTGWRVASLCRREATLPAAVTPEGLRVPSTKRLTKRAQTSQPKKSVYPSRARTSTRSESFIDRTRTVVRPTSVSPSMRAPAYRKCSSQRSVRG